MKKTIITFVLIIIGICVAIDGSAQKDRISTFPLRLHDDPQIKMVLAINPFNKEVIFKATDSSENRSHYYDYQIINQVCYTFSLASGVTAPKTVDDCLTSENYVLISSNVVIIAFKDKTRYVLDYDMSQEALVEEFASLLAGLMGLKPKSNSSSGRSSSTVRKPAETLSAKTNTVVSLINVPALPKEMTEIQMVMHPFGVLTDNLDGYTQQQVAKDLTTLFTDNVTTYESSLVSINHLNDKGYDMSYMGYIPSCHCYFAEGKLKSYNYTIYFNKESYTLEETISIAKRFVEELQVNGIPLSQSNPSSYDHYIATLVFNERVISVKVNSASQFNSHDSWTIYIDIRRR